MVHTVTGMMGVHSHGEHTFHSVRQLGAYAEVEEGHPVLFPIMEKWGRIKSEFAFFENSLELELNQSFLEGNCGLKF